MCYGKCHHKLISLVVEGESTLYLFLDCKLMHMKSRVAENEGNLRTANGN